MLSISAVDILLISFVSEKRTKKVGIYIDEHVPNCSMKCYFQEVLIGDVSLKKKKKAEVVPTLATLCIDCGLQTVSLCPWPLEFRLLNTAL